MSSVFLFALLGILIGRTLARKEKFPVKLKKKVPNKPWPAGIVLLLVNTAIIAITVFIAIILNGLLHGPSSFYILSLLVLSFCAPMVSVYIGLSCKYIVGGRVRDRLAVSVIGHSIYAAMFIYFLYRNAVLQPEFQGQDLFMQSIGYMFAMLICTGAFITGLVSFCSPLPDTIKRNPI